MSTRPGSPQRPTMRPEGAERFIQRRPLELAQSGDIACLFEIAGPGRFMSFGEGDRIGEAHWVESGFPRRKSFPVLVTVWAIGHISYLI